MKTAETALSARKIRAILLDLDNTLVKTSSLVAPYFLWHTCRVFYPHCSPAKTIHALKAVKAAAGRHGDSRLNYHRFIDVFAESSAVMSKKVEAVFRNGLLPALAACHGYFSGIPHARRFIHHALGRFTLVLATNPIWPECFVRDRLRFADIDGRHFALLTHSENMNHCKPHLAYYDTVLTQLSALGIKKEHCLMIGDDMCKDGSAIYAGISTAIIHSKNDEIQIIRRKEKSTLFTANWQTISHHLGIALCQS